MENFDIVEELAKEHIHIERFRHEVLLMMLDVCGKMQAVQKTILSEYGAAALFEDHYNCCTAVTYLAQSIVNMLRAHRCILDQSHRNHVNPFNPEQE